jgi:tRNA pseudouridine13 synthase
VKLKRLPEDFQVEEQIDLAPRGGPFSLYRLTKQSLGTPEAIDAILRHWNLARWQIAYAGLKDRHALTMQHVTIKSGPRRGMAETNLKLEYIGQVERPLHARDIRANRFTVVIRDLTTEKLAAAKQALAEVARFGVPNYFDDQRFGSLGESGEFIARPWCLGDYERALWLALAEPNVHDDPAEREQKRLLREHWNDWPAAKAALARSHRRSIVTYLADKPGDFRRALALVRQDLRSLWLAAFQSHLWNQALAQVIRQTCRSQQLTAIRIAGRDLPLFTGLEQAQADELREAVLPLPSARLHLDEGPLKSLYDDVLARDGLSLRQIRVKYPRDAFFSRGDRRAVFQPDGLEHEAADDDLYPHRQKVRLRFALSRGTYATMLVKRVTGATWADVSDSSEGADELR